MARKPTKKQQILKSLTGVKGIGPKTAEAIYTKCGGKKCLHTLETDPESVADLSGVRMELVNEARVQLQPSAFGDRMDITGTVECLHDEKRIREEFSKHWQALKRQKRYCEMVLLRHRERLIARPDVTGLHVGLWRRGGMVVCPLQYCIRVHVVKKLKLIDREKTLLAANSLMPTPLESLLDGVRVDILEQTYCRTATLPGEATKKSTKIIGGIPIAPANDSDSWGTLGMPVVNVHDGRRRYLTNAHVVGRQSATVQQPASSTADPSLNIGTIADEPILNELIDAALITPKPGSRRSRLKIDGVEGGFIARDLNSTDVDLRTRLFKVGASTGETVGRVKSIDADVDFGEGRVMKQQILVESDHKRIVQGGDSGSLLFAKDTENGINIIVGLVHGQANNAGANREGFSLVACHISKVIDELKITFE